MNFEQPSKEQIQDTYDAARKAYARFDVSTDDVITRLADVPVSVNCWQGDDLRGLENLEQGLDGGGIMATGNYPGVARTGDELRADMLQAFSLIPGNKRANLHAFYAETGATSVDRDDLRPEHFSNWMAWSKEHDIPLDFNPTFFCHPKAESGYTLSCRDHDVRDFWIRHGIASRAIAQAMADNQGCPCINNFWVPDGCKDSPADRWSPRKRLVESYDRIFDPAHGVDTAKCIDTVESKLFGIGSEDYVVGSHEFYLGYALTRDCTVCLDMGHFHPTETLHDKISAILQFEKRLLLHVSRPIRWDSDHIVILNDDLRNLFLEIVRGNALDRVYVALDFFDASVNRIGAWVIGVRSTMKALLYALLEPTALICQCENEGHGAEKLALMEEMKTMPFGAVWDYYCLTQNVPVGAAWLDKMRAYETNVLYTRR